MRKICWIIRIRMWKRLPRTSFAEVFERWFCKGLHPAPSALYSTLWQKTDECTRLMLRVFPLTWKSWRKAAESLETLRGSSSGELGWNRGVCFGQGSPPETKGETWMSFLNRVFHLLQCCVWAPFKDEVQQELEDLISVFRGWDWGEHGRLPKFVFRLESRVDVVAVLVLQAQLL